jgi:hypothetical protein
LLAQCLFSLVLEAIDLSHFIGAAYGMERMMVGLLRIFSFVSKFEVIDNDFCGGTWLTFIRAQLNS